jgi:hypothetical protein
MMSIGEDRRYVFINTVGANAKVQTLVKLQMQLYIATSAKPKTAPIAALTFTNRPLLPCFPCQAKG